MLPSPHLASPSVVQTPPAGVPASASKNKGMDNYKQGKYVDAIKCLSWAMILLEKTGDGAAFHGGRVEEKMRWSQGIHQAVEAKGGVKIELVEATKAQFSHDYSDHLARPGL
ncbi:hypothetical protein ACSBR1_017397 [Camellia fascicularis]